MSPPDSWQQINELFAAVVDLPAEERRARLASAPVGDPIRREVESLLAALDSGDLKLDPSPGASHLTLGGEAALLVVSLVGRRLGPWSVLREVGRGGMGAVYEAVRADDQYQKRVAIKTLTRGADSATVARRFQQERQILASLEHPNIATLIDGGVTEEGLPYLVMEYVDGAPIDHYCAQQELALRARLDLFRQVCAAVQFAHRNLVVHRDLKPSNVLVTPDGNVKLVDFGIAKLLQGNPLGERSLTETGLRAFTTSYASPEQVRGDAISTSSDVYSLGAMLYLLVAGRLPFEVARLTPAEAFRRILEDTPPPPSRVCTADAAQAMGLGSRERLARELAGELDDIVLATLRKEPERRYATVNAFAEDLKRFLQGQQVAARPDTWRYRVRAFTRRNPRFVAMTGIAALALVLGAAAAGWQARRAGLERDRARAEATRSSRVVSFIEQTLSMPVRSALTEATVQLLDQAVLRARSELADDPVARAAVYRTAANAYTIHNHAARAGPLLDSALILHRRFAGAQSTEVGRDLTVAARLAYSRGELDSAVAHAAEAVRLLKAYPSDRPIDLSTALVYHSFALTYDGWPREAIRIAEEGIRLEAARPLPTLLPYLHMALGEGYGFAGDAARYELEYRRALKLYDSLPIPEPPERGIAELGLAGMLVLRGAAAEATSHANQALATLTRLWGADHSYTARAHGLLARIALARGDTLTARRQFALAEGTMATSRLGVVDAFFMEREVATYYILTGQPLRGVARLERFWAAHGSELAQSTFIDGAVRLALGYCLIAARRPAEALREFQAARRTYVQAYGDTNANTAIATKYVVLASLVLSDTAEVARLGPLLHPDTLAAVRRRALGLTRQGGP